VQTVAVASELSKAEYFRLAKISREVKWWALLCEASNGAYAQHTCKCTGKQMHIAFTRILPF
jgi:hypothetical protein